MERSVPRADFYRGNRNAAIHRGVAGAGARVQGLNTYMGKLTLGLIILFASAIGSTAEDNRPPVQLPGQQTDGSVLLPNQWSLRPVGRQIELGDFPINIAVHPQSRFAAILHSGYSKHGIMLVDLAIEKVVN